MDFDYKEIRGIDGKRYMRISMTYDQRIWSEDCRIYWFHMIWGAPFAKMRILNRILKELA